MPKSYLYGGSLIALAAVAALAHAPAAMAATAVQSEAASLDEVVVVARRTEERLQDVPISVTAISADTLQQTSISSGADLIKLVPSLSVQQMATGAGTTYSLRGIRTGVVTYFNEVATTTVAVDDQIWDLGSVQALAGPQGTLFGRNSTGGAILFVPQRPTGDFGGYVEGSYGNYNFRELTGVVNIPLGETLKVRAGARIIRRDGVVENVGVGPDMQALGRDIARLSILFDPTSRISNYTVIDYSRRDEAPYALIASGWTRSAGCLAPAPAACLPGYTRGQVPAVGDAQEARGIRSTSTDLPAFEDSETYGLSNVFTAQLLENLTFKYVFGYRYLNSVEGSSKANIPLPIEYGYGGTLDRETWSHELQLQGNLFDRLTWNVGYFDSRDEGRGVSEYSLFLPPGTLPTTLGATANTSASSNASKAFFGQATLKVTDAFNITAGIRRTEDESDTRNSRRTPQFTFFGPSVCALPVGARGVNSVACIRTISGKWDAVTYNLSADYRFSEQLLAYVTSRRGYNGGGFNGSVPDTNTPGSPLPTYEPEYITDYEAGIKADWSVAGMPIRTNLSVYQAKYSDIQRVQRGFSVTGAIISGIANGPKATIKGVQLESAFKPLPELTLTANYGYLYTRYDSGSNGFPQGNKFAQAPENTLNLSATYRRDLPPGGQFVGNLTYTYQSEVTFQDDQSTSSTAFQKAYSIMDARVGWENVAGGPIDVAFFIKNLTDEAYAVERQDQTALFGFTGSVYNDPRTFGVELKYAFGE